MPAIDFSNLLLLLLLPVALIPFFKRKSDTITYAWTDWLPEDSIGHYVDWLRKLLAALAIAAIIFGLSGPGRSESGIERIGRGAELSIVMDRSSSMDRKIWRNGFGPNDKGKTRQTHISAAITLTKNDVVREALTRLLNERPDNRYAFTLFNAAPMRVAPFTDNVSLLESGLKASDIGRGPSETNMGLGLLAAIEAFEGRSYTGSRAILLVSDGGAKLKEPMRKKIAEGLARNRISLYFIYIQSNANSPNLELVGTDVDSTLEEVALHVFFKGLKSDYQVFQASDPESMDNAIKRIDEQQNLPLTFYEQLPRIDYSQPLYIVSIFCIGLLLLLSALQRMSWS